MLVSPLVLLFLFLLLAVSVSQTQKGFSFFIFFFSGLFGDLGNSIYLVLSSHFFYLSFIFWGAEDYKLINYFIFLSFTHSFSLSKLYLWGCVWVITFLFLFFLDLSPVYPRVFLALFFYIFKNSGKKMS